MRRTLFSRSPTVRRHFRTSYLSKCIRTSCYFLVASIPDLPASSIRPRDFPSRATVSARDENSLLIRSFAGNYIIMRRAEATASPQPLSWQPTRLARRKQASRLEGVGGRDLIFNSRKLTISQNLSLQSLSARSANESATIIDYRSRKRQSASINHAVNEALSRWIFRLPRDDLPVPKCQRVSPPGTEETELPARRRSIAARQAARGSFSRDRIRLESPLREREGQVDNQRGVSAAERQSRRCLARHERTALVAFPSKAAFLFSLTCERATLVPRIPKVAGLCAASRTRCEVRGREENGNRS